MTCLTPLSNNITNLWNLDNPEPIVLYDILHPKFFYSIPFGVLPMLCASNLFQNWVYTNLTQSGLSFTFARPFYYRMVITTKEMAD